MNQKIEEGLKNLNNEKNIVENKIIEFAKSDYIQFLESKSEEDNNLINALGELQLLFKSTLNSSNEINLIRLFDKKIEELQNSANNKSGSRNPSSILEMMSVVYKNDYTFYLSEINNLIGILNRYKGLKSTFDDLLVDNLREAIVDVNKELVGFRKSRNIADNLMTEDIYNSAVIKYRKTEKNYRYLFLGTLLTVILVSLKLWDTDYINNIINQPSYAKSAIFWSVKITTLIASITLITYFLKQSAHYQRLADQNYQTQLELQAYPTFMESIPTYEAASVRKELALKYFGREIDGAAQKDMSNLISDQMKSTTEMVKATTEAIKNLKG
ncbi:hypothetical protein [Acinetobacter calcoaceticus]|uniref:Uncharacterized protein n=1 Tax=Acinetobacter calcoaceticus TaxID=471 RepID=A0ABD5AQC4_ACICA|nr:hypothetical protein [Acinetobacter calcoaceticus]MDP9804533.1 hypothetical protein [Acinetobacter calcoaceticus]